jgi:hypothetical protein
MNELQTYGIAWFYEEDWEEWKIISDDQLEENYSDWLISAELAKSNFEKDNMNVEKVFIKPMEFKKWCKKHFKKLNSSSRSAYVTELLLRK